MKKIVHCDLPGEYHENAFADEPMVIIRPGDRILVEMQYPILKMKNAVSTCYMREEAAKRLIRASKLLPGGLKLKIWDAWRPFSLQEELYIKYRKEIISSHDLDENDPLTEKIVRGFVSLPNDDPENPPVHTTGGAVDLTLCDENGRDLDMGTCFDSFSETTHIDYFEKNEKTEAGRDLKTGTDLTEKKEHEIRENRRILYQVMTDSGFTNLPSEWWHYDYGDKFWGYYNKMKTLYKGVFWEGLL